MQTSSAFLETRRRVNSLRTQLRQLELPPGLPFNEWANFGEELCECKDSDRWALGAWLNYGRDTYSPEDDPAADARQPDAPKYRHALATLNLKWGTLLNYARTERTIPFARRRLALTFGHHAAVLEYALTPAQQDKFLLRAEVEDWTRADLRAAIYTELNPHSASPQQTLSFTFKAWRLPALRYLDRQFEEQPPEEWQPRRRLEMAAQLEPIVRRYERLTKGLTAAAPPPGKESIAAAV